MSATVTNLDLFREFFEFVRNPHNDLNATIKEFGGSSFYIPSHKTTFRNDEIIEKYKAQAGKVGFVKELAREYDLTERQIYDITKECRTPSLFE